MSHIDYDFNSIDSEPVDTWANGHHLVTINDARVYENLSQKKASVIVEITNREGQISTRWYSFKHFELSSADPEIKSKRQKMIKKDMSQLKEIQDVCNIRDRQDAKALIGKSFTVKIAQQKTDPTKFWINGVFPADQYSLLSQTDDRAPTQQSYYRNESQQNTDFQLTPPSRNDPNFQGTEGTFVQEEDVPF